MRMPKKNGGRTGPLGGRTTSRRGQTKKVYWLDDELCEALRKRAFDERLPEVAIVRAALRKHLRLDAGDPE